MKKSIETGREVFEKEIAVLNSVKDQIGDTFDRMLSELMKCEGKAVLIGMYGSSCSCNTVPNRDTPP